VITLEGSTVRQASLAVIGVDGVPVRVVDAERLLIGVPLSAESMAAAAESVRRTLEPHADIHATAAYRRHLAGIITVRALMRAAERARLA
jgi:carbon-monoxide dehydrogenase medium subunit